jgi:hypothetical protein
MTFLLPLDGWIYFPFIVDKECIHQFAFHSFSSQFTLVLMLKVIMVIAYRVNSSEMKIKRLCISLDLLSL